MCINCSNFKKQLFIKQFNMKNLIIAFVFLLSFSGYSQKTYNLDTIAKNKKEISYKPTADNAIYKGESYTVYISKNNKLFIFVTSKKGNKYKKYLN